MRGGRRGSQSHTATEQSRAARAAGRWTLLGRALWATPTGDGKETQRGRKKKKRGWLVEDMTKIFFAVTAHRTRFHVGTVPSLNSPSSGSSEKNATPVRARSMHLATSHHPRSHTRQQAMLVRRPYAAGASISTRPRRGRARCARRTDVDRVRAQRRVDPILLVGFCRLSRPILVERNSLKTGRSTCRLQPCKNRAVFSPRARGRSLSSPIPMLMLRRCSRRQYQLWRRAYRAQGVGPPAATG